jgi:glycosyltransferase involved in cell wall biosynthesis
MAGNKQLRICVVGAGTRFLGGISYYTLYLVNALAGTHDVSAILMRQLLPTRLYPGKERVGAKLTQLEYDPTVRIYDGVDWYWLPSMIRALVFLIRERPNVVVFQWWSGTVLHSYLLLALVARILNARIVIEFHEVLDPGESNLALAQSYVQLVAPILVRMAHGFVVHSEYDRKLLHNHYKLEGRPVGLIAHGPYNQYLLKESKQAEKTTSREWCNLLFLGLIRPYKGLDDLIRAFDSLPESAITRYHLTVVGETWEGCTEPASLIEHSKYRDRITFVNRYVSDEEVATFFAQADAVVFPYHRASTSGTLHIAMSQGLPVVVTQVGGLIEAVAHYEGAILTPPGDPVALRDALLQISFLCGKRYTDPHSWENTTQGYQDLFMAL